MGSVSNCEIDRLKELYRDGFIDDSPQFLNYFFESYIKDNSILTYHEGGRLISCGYIIQKPATVFSKNTLFPYLTALTTHSDFRGQNKIANIMSSAYHELIDRGCAYVGLHPFNFLYYKKFSFADISYCAHRRVEGGTEFSERKITEDDYDSVINIYHKATKQFKNKLLLNRDILQQKIRSYRTDGIEGKILAHSGEDFCVAFIENGRAEHLFSTNIKATAMAENLKDCTYYDYSVPHYPFLQGRIVDAKRALVEYDYDKAIKKSLAITVFDPDIQRNCFSAQLEIADGVGTLNRLKSENIDLVFDISTLCGAMFCGGAGIFGRRLNFFCDKF